MADKSGKINAIYRKKLLSSLKKINPSTIVKITGKQVQPNKSGFFSDWHDVFRDGNRWTDGFGRAGDRKKMINRGITLKKKVPIKRTTKRRQSNK